MGAATNAGHDIAFVDRLMLDADTVDAMAAGLEAIAALPDPVGEITIIGPAGPEQAGQV